MIINNTLNKASIVTPSMIHAYSLGMEYVEAWIFSKLDKDIFKSVHISDRDAIDAFRNYDAITSLVTNKPSIAIESRMDMEYLNDVNQLPDGGLDLFLSRTRKIASFYSDPINNVNIALNSQTIRINYNVKIRVTTKMQQIEWMHYIRQACRIGETQTHDYDMDFHVPKQIMLQLAQDCGFELNETKTEIEDIRAFLRHVNQYSYFPFTFKLRTVNQQMEFFIRVTNISIHLSCLDNISADDGERINMVTDNYIIEFPVHLTMSAPKMYIYYSEKKHDRILPNDELNPNAVQVGLHDIKIPDIPDVNCKGWKVFISADYDLYDKDEDINKDEEFTYIDFMPLIKDSDVELVFNYAKRYYIHPSTFLEFRAYGLGDCVPLEMNWDNLTAKMKKSKCILRLGIVLYLNKEFVNERLLILTSGHSDRIDNRDKQ